MTQNRLMRTRLLLGEEKLKRLQNACVMVLGCGAVGSYAIEALARAGIGHLKLVDFDTVATSNINRQLYALNSTIGQKKIDVARARIADISPDIKVDTFDLFLDDSNANEVIQDVDFVIDAIDSKQSKIAIYRICQAKSIPFISSMGAALRTDATKIKIDKLSKTSVCPLAANLRQLCKKSGIDMNFPVVFSTEPAHTGRAENRQMGSLSTITGIFGLILANYVINELIK